MRVVLDTNVVVSFALNPNSHTGEAYRLAATMCTLLASDDTLSELTRVLSRPKLDRFSTSARRQAALDGYLSLVTPCAVTHTVTNCRDPTDNKFLALALTSSSPATTICSFCIPGVPSRFSAPLRISHRFLEPCVSPLHGLG